MVPTTVVLTCEPCLAFLRTSSGSFRTGSPRSDGSSRPLVRRSEKSGEQTSCEPRSRGRSRGVGAGSSVLGQAFRLERLLGDGWCLKRVLRSERWAKEADRRAPVLTGRPSGRRPNCPSGLLCFSFLGRPMKYMFVFLGRARAWKPVLEGPRVYEPDRSPRAPGRFEPNRLGDFFVLLAGARERTRGCSPRAPGWFGQNRLGDVWLAGVCACFLVFEMEFVLTKASLCSRGVVVAREIG